MEVKPEALGSILGAYRKSFCLENDFHVSRRPKAPEPEEEFSGIGIDTTGDGNANQQ